MSQQRAPLLEVLVAYAHGAPNRLHVPGHKGGRWADPDWLQHASSLLPLDLTEVPGMDDLFAPEGCIAQAQDLAASLFGAAASFFLVGGTTAGIEALVLATSPGREVLVPRHAHRSLLSGLILADSLPVWLPVEHDPVLGIPLAINVDTAAAALHAHPNAAALWLVRPTYEGLAQTLAPLVALAQQAGIPLLVDEAHGGHLAFNRAMPVPALQEGATAVVQSLHKTCGSLTQSSILHVAEGFPLLDRLRDCLRLTQSSSPSYWLMASLDAARRQLAVHGEPQWAAAVELAAVVREQLNSLPHVHCPDSTWAMSRGLSLDPTRLLIDVGERGLTGHEAAQHLQHAGVVVELAGYRHLVGILTPGDGPAQVDRLVHAVAELPHTAGRSGPVPALPPIPKMVLRPRQAFFVEREYLSLDEARGRIAAEWIAPYPPGIPVIMPGEVFSPDIVEYLHAARARGWHIQGGQADASYVAVIKE